MTHDTIKLCCEWCEDTCGENHGCHNRSCACHAIHDTIKQEVREEFLRLLKEHVFRCGDELKYDNVPQGLLLPFLDEVADRVREATIQEAIKLLPETPSFENEDMKHGWGMCREETALASSPSRITKNSV